MKRCPFCAEEIQDAAIVCRFCQRNLPQSAPVSTPIDQQNARANQAKAWRMLAPGGVGIVFLAVLAAVLKGPDEAAPRRTSESKRFNLAHARMLGFEEQERAAAGLKILKADGCDAVVRTFHQGNSPTDGSAFWSFGCRNGRAFVVRIHADATGSTTILDCEVMKRMGAPCFQTLDETKQP